MRTTASLLGAGLVLWTAVLPCPAADAPPLSWRRPAEIERGTGFADAPHAIPLGIAAEGNRLAILYGVRTPDFNRYAVYVRWSRDEGRTWEERRLLGQATWVATGAAQTLSPRLVRYGGDIAAVGAWEGDTVQDDPRAPQILRVHRLAPEGERLLLEEATSPEKQDQASWIHRIDVASVAGEDVVWGVRARQADERIELQPFRLSKEEGKDRFVPLGAWRPAGQGWVTETLSLSGGADGAAALEGYDLTQGGWVIEQADGRRAVEDPLEAYRSTVAPVVGCRRWPARPERSLVTFLAGKSARSGLFERRSGRWTPVPARWEQPCYVWDAAFEKERCVFAASLGAGIDQEGALIAVDAQGQAAREAAFAGLAGGADEMRVALGPAGRIHLFCRAFPLADEREEYLLFRSKAPVEAPLSPKERQALEEAARSLASPDADVAAGARALLVGKGPAAVAVLRGARKDAAPALAEEIDRLLARIVPPWADGETYTEED